MPTPSTPPTAQPPAEGLLHGLSFQQLLLLAFVLIGFFLWLAENISTFYGIWSYPNQMGAWSRVHWGKWSSWSLLVIMTFTIVAGLKHVKASIHVPPE